MQWQRTLVLGLGCGAIAVWLAAAATSTPPANPVPSSLTPRPIELRGAELAGEVARLRERLRPTVAPLQRRDLFRYRREPAGSVAPTVAIAAPPTAGMDVADPVPAIEPFTLVGLAEDEGTEGVVRTAIISGAGDLFIVKEGDAVTSRYRVATITADLVELTDTGGGAALRLALR